MGSPGDLQPGAPAQVEHGLVKDARHHIDALAEVGQDLTGVFGGVVKGDQLELDARVVLLHTLGHRLTRNWAGVMGEVPMRITSALSCMAFLARVTESLQYWMMYLAS